jgi:hypothetical protein
MKRMRMPKQENLVTRFLKSTREDRLNLWGITRLEIQPGQENYIRIEHPAGLVALSGYLKRIASDGTEKVSVYCRGQCRQHNRLIPSLFRQAKNNDDIENLVKAEQEIENLVKIRLGNRMKRFRERHISAILQHYGIRTSWIDLVDNLYIAVWFALHDFQNIGQFTCTYSNSAEDFGWIYFIQSKTSDNPNLRIRDLRSEHLPLSLRPHAQHGISATRWGRDHWNWNNINLSSYIAAVVQIPNDPKLWNTKGYMFTQQFLFPEENHDHTYKVLLRDEMSNLLDEIEYEYGFKKHSIGRILRYSHNGKRFGGAH